MSLYSIPTLCGAILVLLIGIFVLIENKKSMINISFTIFCFSVFVWLFAYTISYSITNFKIVTFCCNLACTAVIFTPPALYHFFVEYLKFQKLRKTIIIPYIIMSILTPFFFVTNFFLKKPHKAFWGYYSTAGSFHPIYLVIHFMIALIPFLLLFKKYFKEPGISSTEKIRLKYCFIWYTVAAFSGIDFIQKYGFEFYPFGFIFIVIFTIVIAYSILRYRLMDIHVIIKRYGVYSFATGLLTAFFVILIITLTKYLSDLTRMTSLTITGIAGVLITLLFNPIRNKIQTIIDKHFYKKTYDYYDVLQKVGQEFESSIHLENILTFIRDTIFSTLNLKCIYFLSYSSGIGYSVVYSKVHETSILKKELAQSEIKIPLSPPLIKGDIGEFTDKDLHEINEKSDMVQFLTTQKDTIIKEELNHIVDIKEETIDNIINELMPFNGEVLVPILIDKHLDYILILGDKLSGDIFTDEDVKLLNTISKEASIAIKNTRLYIEKLQSEKLASIGMMAATFAHEVRNPLTSVKTFAQLLPELHSDPDFIDNYSKIVRDSALQIDWLVSELLDFSSAKKSFDMHPLNIFDVIEQVISEMKMQMEIKNRKIKFEKKYTNTNINISGDQKKLNQAFSNLINNCCQAIPENKENGTLEFDINQYNENVYISIKDNGEGISRDDLPKIFEPFFTKKTKGLGLGLAITKKNIEEHGGKISVISRLHEGTTFTISLPINKDIPDGGHKL